MNQRKGPELSVVVPLYNEEAVIEEMYKRLTKVLKACTESYEIILVNDGSKDRTLDLANDICGQDKRVKLISFSRNFGHQIAITAGMDKASGQATVVIDADLQDPPEVIPEMMAKWKEGYQVVYGVREKRKGESKFKLFTAALFYRLLKRLTSVEIPVDTGDFRLIDRRVLLEFRKMREQARFVRGMISWVGFRQAEVRYIRDKRFAGETKYPFKKMLKLALNAVTGFSYFPLQLATYLGFISAGISVISIPIVVILRLISSPQLTGQATTLITVLFFGGVQLISLGIIGEYIGRIYDEVKRRPIYIVSEGPSEDHNPTRLDLSTKESQEKS